MTAPSLNKDEVLSLWRVMRLFHSPEKYGCRIDTGDPETYQQRVGTIIDDAMQVFAREGLTPPFR